LLTLLDFLGGGAASPELPRDPGSGASFHVERHTPCPFARSAPRTEDALNLAVSRASNDQHTKRDTRMFGGRLRGTEFLLSGLVLLGLATVAPAKADGPGPEFKLLTDG